MANERLNLPMTTVDTAAFSNVSTTALWVDNELLTTTITIPRFRLTDRDGVVISKQSQTPMNVEPYASKYDICIACGVNELTLKCRPYLRRIPPNRSVTDSLDRTMFRTNAG